MNAPPARLTARSSSAVAPFRADEELGLAELLDLFTSEDPAVAPSPLGSLRPAALRCYAWTQGWMRRAGQWGAGPGAPPDASGDRPLSARPAATEVQ